MPKKNKVIAFCPADKNNLKMFEGLENSLRKFHSEKELPLKLIGPQELESIQDPMKFYKMTPLIAKELLKEYETVIKLDADQIITGDISHVWEGEFDIACVNNSNPREMKALTVTVWDLHPLTYLNCGFVVMKSQKFVDHWWNLCNSEHFDSYQYKEQDLLNIMCFYGDYNVKLLDMGEKWHGLISKGYWPSIKMEGDKMILPASGEWPQKGDREIVCIHVAGGNDPNKGNLKIRFQKEVYERIKWLTSEEN